MIQITKCQELLKIEKNTSMMFSYKDNQKQRTMKMKRMNLMMPLVWKKQKEKQDFQKV